VTRGQLPQRAGSLGLNGGGAAAAVPPAGGVMPFKSVVLMVKLALYYQYHSSDYTVHPLIPRKSHQSQIKEDTGEAFMLAQSQKINPRIYLQEI